MKNYAMKSVHYHKGKGPAGQLDEAILTELRVKVLADINRRLGGYYTALHGAPLGDNESRLDLAETLQQQFFAPKQSEHTQQQSLPRVCVLLGNSGAGKTWFGLNLVKQLWQAHEAGYNPKVPIPLWIPLKGMKGNEKQVLPTYLKTLGLKKRAINALRESGCPLFMVLDGYDELATDKNLYALNGWGAWQSSVQVLITCRHEILIGGFQANRHRFEASTSALERLLVYEAKPFDQTQIETVVTRYVACHSQTAKRSTTVLAVSAESPRQASAEEGKGKAKVTASSDTSSIAAVPTGSSWNAARYLAEMAKLPELQSLIDKPFVLWIVLESLPVVVAEIEAEAASQQTQTQATTAVQTAQTSARQQRQRQQLTRYRLYQTFLAGRNQREAIRLSGMQKGKFATKLLKACRAGGALDHFGGNTLAEVFANYSRQLALAMHQRRRYVVHWQAKLASEDSPAVPEGIDVHHTQIAEPTDAYYQHDRWAAPFLNTKRQPLLKYLLDASPIYREGEHSWAFLHSSLIEHAVSEDLFKGAVIEAWMMTGQNLNASNLQRTPDILNFLVDQVHSLPDFKETLFEVIKASRYEPRYWKAAANAATILNWAGVSFTNQDWHRVRLGGKEHDTDWGADLSQSILDFTDLSEADLRYVNFTRASLRQVNFNGACLDGIALGERAHIQGYICTYSADGKWLAAASEHGKGGRVKIKLYDVKIKLYDTATYTVQRRLRIPRDIKGIQCLAWDPQGVQLAGGSHTNYYGKGKKAAICLWDVANGHCTRVLEEHTNSTYIQCLAFHPDPKAHQLASCNGRYLGSKDNAIRLWDLTSGRCVQVLEGHPYSVICLAYHPDPQSHQLASASYREIRLWDLTSGRCVQVQELKEHMSSFGCLAYHPDPRAQQLASGHADLVKEKDNSIRLWDLASGCCKRVLEGHTKKVSCLAYHPDPKVNQLASGSGDMSIRLWDLASGRCVRVLRGNIGIESLVYHPSGAQLASCDGKLIRLWKVSSDHCDRTLEEHADTVDSVAFHPSGMQLASASSDGTIRLWDVSSGRCERALKEHTDKIMSIAYHPAGTQLASVSWDRTFRLWEVSSGRCQREILMGLPARYIVYHPSGTQLALACRENNAIRLWEVSSGRFVRELKGHTDNEIVSLAYHPSGTQLASGCADKTIRLWDVSSGHCQRKIVTKEYIACVAYHPAGTQLVSSSVEETIRLWNVKTGRCERVLQGHTNMIRQVAYHPSGKQLASVSADDTLRLWEINSGNCLAIQVFEDGFRSLAWSPNGQQLVTGGYDNAVRLWAINGQQSQPTYQLLWQHGAHKLNVRGLNIAQTTGLSDRPQVLRLFNQRSDILSFDKKGKPQTKKKSLQGEPSQTLTSEKVLQARAAQVHIPKGQIAFSTAKGDFTITPESWFLAMVKKKKASPHVWLLLYGLTPECYTHIQALHFYQDTNKPTRLNGTVGKGLIQIRDISPFDLKSQVSEWQMLSWRISQQEGHTLVANVRHDQQQDLSYLLSGRGIQLLNKQGEDSTTAYNCLSWCEKQLAQINKKPVVKKTWIDFFVAVPEHYLPAEDEDSGNRQVQRQRRSRFLPSRRAKPEDRKAKGQPTDKQTSPRRAGFFSPRKRTSQALTSRVPEALIEPKRSKGKKHKVTPLHIPEGYIEEPWLKDDAGSFIITPDAWLIALVRPKSQQGRPDNEPSWLVLQGLTQQHRTVTQTIHFYLARNKTKRYRKPIGKGVIRMTDIAPKDLQAQADELDAKVWSVSKANIDKLLTHIQQDQKRKLNYAIPGRSTTSSKDAYTSTRWCEKQLSQIGIQATKKRWYSFASAVPRRYVSSSSSSPSPAPSPGRG